jgi:hypothetical protein
MRDNPPLNTWPMFCLLVAIIVYVAAKAFIN